MAFLIVLHDVLRLPLLVQNPRSLSIDGHSAGNPLKAGFISEPCYNLVYLELAACRLTSLPSGFARLVPNLRNLNLNYNFLEDVRPLEGLTRMRKLTIIGSRVKASKQFVKVLRGMLDVEMLDFRYVARLAVVRCSLAKFLFASRPGTVIAPRVLHEHEPNRPLVRLPDVPPGTVRTTSYGVRCADNKVAKGYASRQC